MITEKLIIAGLVLISFYLFQPSQKKTKAFAVGWIALMYFRNLILMCAVAGELHLYLYTFTKQGQYLKYDPQPLMKIGRKFTLAGQVKDNMFWTLASGVTIWTAYEVLMVWALANGYAPMLTWSGHPFWFVAMFLLMPAWESFYFYWIHRLLHVPLLYKHVHSLHHHNINFGPWSGLSMHPIEHITYLSAVLVHWVIATHPVHILFHLQYYTLTAATTHTGFEGLVIKDENRLKLGTFHHQMHHRYFECNYGSFEILWDRLFGSFHDGTETAKERHKRILGN